MNFYTGFEGLDLIKEFEGCHLTSYYCPSGVLTIGWGHTGTDVVWGQTITQEKADELLKQDLKKFEDTVNKYTTVELYQCMFDALVSFTYNCGSDAFRNSTLLRLLNQKDYEGAAGQFERWVNGSNGPLPGLVRRRAAEEDLFRKDGFPGTKPPAIIITATANTVLKKEPVQSSELPEEKKVSVPEGKSYPIVWHGQPGDGHTKVSLDYGGGNWFIYNDHWKGLNTEDPEGNETEVILPVRYFPQRDNYRDAHRTCFSSSCAMYLEYLKPGTLPGERGDDMYIRTVFTLGDTVEAHTQIRALRTYGVESTFIQNGSLQLLKDKIDEGVPVPIGILHQGPASSPSGGGHWICVIGYDEWGFICHDPWGTLDDDSGWYSSTNGESVHYSIDCIRRRWTVANPNDGWAIV